MESDAALVMLADGCGQPQWAWSTYIVAELTGDLGDADGRQGRTSLQKTVSKEEWYMDGDTNLHGDGEGGKSQKTRVDLHLECCVVDRELDWSL